MKKTVQRNLGDYVSSDIIRDGIQYFIYSFSGSDSERKIEEPKKNEKNKNHDFNITPDRGGKGIKGSLPSSCRGRSS